MGEITVLFNERMRTPSNFSFFDNSDLLIELVPGPDSDETLLSFMWEVTSIEGPEMKI